MHLPDEIIESLLLKAVQQSAVAAHAWVGKGDAKAADAAATEAMRSVFAEGSFQVHVVIGEGERDSSPMLHRGERLGGHTPGIESVYLDCAVDPLDGTSLVEKGLDGAITIAALSEPGGLLGAPDFYMEKLVAPPVLAGKIWLSQSPEERVTALATHLNKSPHELRIAVQDRPRHVTLVQRLRMTGANVELFDEGDVVVALQSCKLEDKFHCFMGIGAAPEGVITAAAVRCVGGVFLGRFVYDPEEAQSGLIGTCKHTNRERLIAVGILNPDKHYEAHELAPGRHLYVALSGITNGDFVRGVVFDAKGTAITESMITSTKRQAFEKIIK